MAAAEPVPMTFLINFVRRYRLRITSTSGGQHVQGSFHYSHRALDATGSAREMKRCSAAACRHPEWFEEVFHDPLGRYVDGHQLHKGKIGGHGDHVHLAR